jgi:hypothetical protein
MPGSTAPEKTNERWGYHQRANERSRAEPRTFLHDRYRLRSRTLSECSRDSPAGKEGNHAGLQMLPVSPAQAEAGAIVQHHLIFAGFIQFESADAIEPDDG